jgi:hypothetical protein
MKVVFLVWGKEKAWQRVNWHSSCEYLFSFLFFSNDCTSLPNRVDYLFELIVVSIKTKWD